LQTINGAAINPAQISLTSNTVPTGFTLNANGTITIAPATPAGVYTVTYTICEVLNPSNCNSASEVLAVIDAVDDAYSAINGFTGTTTASVLVNDTLNGAAVNPIQISLTPNTVPTGFTLNANGTITIAPATPAGVYTVIYTICEVLNPSNCDGASVSISVGSCLDFPINDCDDDGVTNGQEILDGTNPTNSCDLIVTNQDVSPNLPWLVADCDGDGVSNGQEVVDGTNPTDACDYVASNVVLPQGGLWLVADCDGDGVINNQEILDGTDPLNSCDSIEENVSLPQSQEFLDGDCDGDGLINGEEIGNNPNKPNDSNGNGIPDYLEINNYSMSEDDLEIFNLVTPNEDGDNDVFVIRNIELYPNNTVKIFNRWGVKVNETKGYGQNQKYFRGLSEGRVTISQSSELPVGSYFYVVQYVNVKGENKQRSGYLYINR
jgi:gliding motility-associated-like protein